MANMMLSIIIFQYALGIIITLAWEADVKELEGRYEGEKQKIVTFVMIVLWPVTALVVAALYIHGQYKKKIK
jgi:hypothetical protein